MKQLHEHIKKKKLPENWHKTHMHPRIVVIVFVLEMILFGYLLYSYYQLNMFRPDTSAQSLSNPEFISRNVTECLELQHEGRQTCAEEVGEQIAILFSAPKDQYRECLKFRPYYVRECQLGLKNGQ